MKARARAFGFGLVQDHAKVEVRDPLRPLEERVQVEPVRGAVGGISVAEAAEREPVLVQVQDKRELVPAARPVSGACCACGAGTHSGWSW
jgi:hypothetical protein